MHDKLKTEPKLPSSLLLGSKLSMGATNVDIDRRRFSVSHISYVDNLLTEFFDYRNVTI